MNHEQKTRGLYIHKYEKCYILPLIIINSIPIIFISDIASAQIIPDNSLNSTVTPINESKDSITGGTATGSNLFHSFKEFNVDKGREVFFSNPTEINNIFTRITVESHRRETAEILAISS